MRYVLTLLPLLGMLTASAAGAERMTPGGAHCQQPACAGGGRGERLSIVPSNCNVPGCRGCGLGSHCQHCGGFYDRVTGCNSVDGCQGGWFHTCDMYPHYPYFPADHGSYYFRPYNYHNIPRHQASVMRWGGDPRHPYANTVFQNVYAALAEVELEEVIEDALQPVPNRERSPSDTPRPLPTPRVPPAPPVPSPDLPVPPADLPGEPEFEPPFDGASRPSSLRNSTNVSLAPFVQVPSSRRTATPLKSTESTIRVEYLTPE